MSHHYDNEVAEIVNHMLAVANRIVGFRKYGHLSDQQIASMVTEKVKSNPDLEEILANALFPFLMPHLQAATTRAMEQDLDPEPNGGVFVGVETTPAGEIRRHLATATSPLPNQRPAIAAVVVLRGMGNALSGSLSETPEGGLRMLSKVGEDQNHLGRVTHHMIEQFFGYEDVQVFGVQHTVEIDPPSLFTRS